MAAALALLIIPFLLSWRIGIGIGKELSIAVSRMVLQLFFAGIYLHWLFQWDLAWLNLLWFGVMMLVAAITTIQKSSLRLRSVWVPVLVSTVVSTLVVVVFFNAFIARIGDVFAARFLVPIGGMILGNALSGNIVGLTHFYQSLREREGRYFVRLGNGAGQWGAICPEFREALTRAVKPMLASMATIGIVSLPGMMTGQILGGSSPLVATKYQIAIMSSIFTAMSMGTALTLRLSVPFAFDEWGVLKKEIFARKAGGGNR